MYVYCIKRLAHVQSYSYSALWRSWIVETCCDLVADVVQSNVCECYVSIHVDEKSLECFLSCMVIVFSLVFWQWVLEVIWVGSLCQCCDV